MQTPRNKVTGIKLLVKVENFYQQNPNLAYTLGATPPDVGSVRETLFLAWLKPFLPVTSSPILILRSEVAPLRLEAGTRVGNNCKTLQRAMW